MNNKNIRRIVVKQLKIKYPYWKKLTRKTKKELARQILAEVISNYDYDQVLDVPSEEYTGIADQSRPADIRKVTQMGEYIDFYQDNLFYFDSAKKPYAEIYDEELRFIEQLLDNSIISSLISPEMYPAAHQCIQPYQLFRLKIIKNPGISYRKFCTDDYFGRDCKQNRRFVRLSLSNKDRVHYTALCHFIAGLSFKQSIELK